MRNAGRFCANEPALKKNAAFPLLLRCALRPCKNARIYPSRFSLRRRRFNAASRHCPHCFNRPALAPFQVAPIRPNSQGGLRFDFFVQNRRCSCTCRPFANRAARGKKRVGKLRSLQKIRWLIPFAADLFFCPIAAGLIERIQSELSGPRADQRDVDCQVEKRKFQRRIPAA